MDLSKPPGQLYLYYRLIVLISLLNDFIELPQIKSSICTLHAHLVMTMKRKKNILLGHFISWMNENTERVPSNLRMLCFMLQLLKYFTASRPWSRIHSTPKALHREPNNFSAEEREHELFQTFLETRMPKYV